MNVNYILEHSKVQGPGERFTIWVQGCSIHCQDCHNKDTWDSAPKQTIDINTLSKQIINSNCQGLTITGGEPLDQLEEIVALTQIIFPIKNIFLCSGYSFETIKNSKKQILNSIDILCSGPFDNSKKCVSCWKGSENQEVIYLTERGKSLISLPIYKKEYRINKKTGKLLVTGFSV